MDKAKELGYGFAGLQYGGECWIDHSPPDNEQKDDSECNMNCRNDSSQKCGAGYRNSVYAVDASAGR